MREVEKGEGIRTRRINGTRVAGYASLLNANV